MCHPADAEKAVAMGIGAGKTVDGDIATTGNTTETDTKTGSPATAEVIDATGTGRGIEAESEIAIVIATETEAATSQARGIALYGTRAWRLALEALPRLSSAF